MSDQEFDAFAGKYDEALNRGLALTGEGKEYFAEGRVRWLKSRLQKAGVPQPRTCVDYGCGTGTSAPFLREVLGIESYHGFDPSSESVEVATGLHANANVTFSSDPLTFKNVDLVFCNGVFHHIPPAARKASMDQVYQILKSGGVFAFWENNPWNPIVRFMMSRVEFDRDAQLLWPREAIRLGRASGFRCLHRSYYFVFPSALAFARCLEPALSPLPAGGQYLLLFQKP